jgi:hypothetical protein
MQFFIGTFEREWKRRRAALLHEMQMEEQQESEWDWSRRGGISALLQDDSGGTAGTSQPGRPHAGHGRRSGRQMRTRFLALARGSQPAVVKLASYGGGLRAARMISYVSRCGGLPLENERGERIAGKAALRELRGDWAHLFDNRSASRDVGVFEVSVAGSARDSTSDLDEFARNILKAGMGDRRFAYSVEKKGIEEIDIRGVVVLRDRAGIRLTADAKAAAIVQRRFEAANVGREADARFVFRGYGNGVEFATARLRELVERANVSVRNERGRAIGTRKAAAGLVQKEWRRELHSRKGRDVMHLIVSARAGTDASAFRAAVRDFLGEQFSGHRYVFALHDPADDPKETGQGGRRPHIHAHAIITTRSETGGRIATSPHVFRQWRALMAATAREYGIDMELTDRRELASAPAYTRNQIRPVSYSGRTQHEGTSSAAQARYDAKRANRRSAARSERSVRYAVEAQQAWSEIARTDEDETVFGFAATQIRRLQAVLRESQIHIEESKNWSKHTNLRANMIDLERLIEFGGSPMRAMTRVEFDAYEKRVETVLASVEAAIEPIERRAFDEIAATAREVVNIRREYLEVTTRMPEMHLPDVATGKADQNRAVARHGREAVVSGNDIMLKVESAREARDRAIAERRDPSGATANIKRELEHAARLCRAGNTWLREVAESDRGLRNAIDALERSDAQSREIRVGDELEGKAEATSRTVADSPPSSKRRQESAAVAEAGRSHLDPGLEGTSRWEIEASHDGSAERAEEDYRGSDPTQQQAPRVRDLERDDHNPDERGR